MIVTADLANAVSKVNPIFLEGTLKIASAEAKSVGLRDGQIIQAVIENRGDHTKLLIGNKEFEIPKNFHTGDGSKFQAKVSILSNGSAVLTPAGVSLTRRNYSKYFHTFISTFYEFALTLFRIWKFIKFIRKRNLTIASSKRRLK